MSMEGHREFELYNTCPNCREYVLAHLRMRTRIGPVMAHWRDDDHKGGFVEYLRGRACPLCYYQWREYERVYA